MSDKYVFVKIDNNFIGGPASMSADDVINHASIFSMSNLPLAESLIDRYILLVRTVLQISSSLCTLKIMLYNCDELVEQFESSIAEDARIQLHCGRNFRWYLSVTYAFIRDDVN